MHEPPFDRLTIALVEVVAAQIAVDRALRQQVVDDDQDGVGDGDGRLRPAAAGCQAPVLRRQVGALGAGGGVGGLDQAGPQPGTALAGRAACGACRRSRGCPGTARPRRPGAWRWGSASVGADLGHQRLGRRAPDAGDRVQPRDRVLVRAQALGDLGADPGDRRVEEVDVGQLLGHQEALVRPDAPDQRPLQLGDLLAQATLRQLGQCRAVGLPGDQGGQHLPPRYAQDVGGHRGQLDVGAFEGLLQPVGRRGPLPDQARPVAGQLPQLPLRPVRDEAAA